MTRVPLRPLARILEARRKGENPDAIEKENRRIRHEAMRDRMRLRAEGRLLVLAMMFFCAYAVIGARMGMLSASEPEEPRAQASGASIIASRADIVDRHGRILATNMSTHSLYAHPNQMIDPERAAPAVRARRQIYTKSILDFVRSDTQSLMSDLGSADKRKMDEYLTAVRDIEKRIELAESGQVQEVSSLFGAVPPPLPPQ